MIGRLRQRFRSRAAPFGEADLAAWRKLIAEAEKAARNPERDLDPLRRAADGAGKAILPHAHRFRRSPAIQLIDLGRMFWRLSEADRMVRAADLGRLAADVRQALEPSPSPARPFRADIDG